MDEVIILARGNSNAERMASKIRLPPGTTGPFTFSSARILFKKLIIN